MSTRTLIEINHDRLTGLRDRPELLAEIIDELRGAIHIARLNAANARGHPLDIGHRVRLVLQYHHTTEVHVTTDFAGVRL
ncbi:hypothetical protein SB379_06890 [Burkholderia multivorans]|uniref:hypothetical protein n=1 Tax=Burkholderia multivorans TaxID=87883 RepID=UPI000D3A8B54|nr:hypothetical protein [Burkholderia multivorans]MBR8020186.1 hypothetical protein [Burkholderia multivorans]MEB2511594.1 hypothetical protein [Burkholderia multivorans]MEB2521202.1 hypothetical protein [Burkholderia multivorans]MEB2573381.1 hypothetical protein [Burkholderia multivorans]MEB2590541.1 hypothetical protein [Burkholderia multivorans]